MPIYKKRINYRKIYRDHYGPIPKDQNGRTYEIHHIDGDHNNHDPSNLKAVTIEEHYNIHYAQEDWNACLRMAFRMGITPEEKSRLASLQNQQQVVDGTHVFLGGRIQSEHNQRRVAEGTHHLLGPTHNQNRVKNGTHNFVGGEVQRQRVKNGTHPFLGGEISRKTNAERIKNGTHNLLGPESNMKRIRAGTHNQLLVHTCPHCNKSGKGMVMFRHHFDNCSIVR